MTRIRGKKKMPLAWNGIDVNRIMRKNPKTNYAHPFVFFQHKQKKKEDINHFNKKRRKEYTSKWTNVFPHTRTWNIWSNNWPYSNQIMMQTLPHRQWITLKVRPQINLKNKDIKCGYQKSPSLKLELFVQCEKQSNETIIEKQCLLFRNERKVSVGQLLY